MASRERTIAFHIDELARMTEAPSTFVEQIRAIFTRRGVSLDEDALPYLEILEETFGHVALMAKEGAMPGDTPSRLDLNSRRFADSCVELYGRLSSMDDFVRGPGASPEDRDKRRQRARDRATARQKSLRTDKPFFVILAPSDPE